MVEIPNSKNAKRRTMAGPELGHVMRAQIVRVIDGDTVQLLLQLPATVRIKDLWSPELRGIDAIAGHKAKDALEKLLPDGCQVKVKIGTEDASNLGDVFSFGRVVGEVYRMGDDDPVSEIMIQMGHGTRHKHGT